MVAGSIFDGHRILREAGEEHASVLGSFRAEASAPRRRGRQTASRVA